MTLPPYEPAPFKQTDLSEALKAVAEIIRETFAPLLTFFDESGHYYPTKKPPLIHNGRKPRK